MGKLSKDDIEEIIRMIKEGYKYRIIATKFNVDESYIRQIRNKYGVKVVNTHFVRIFDSDGKAYSEKDMENIKALYLEGISLSEIAKMYKEDYRTITTLLKRSGAIQRFVTMSNEIEAKICNLYKIGLNIDIIQRVLVLDGVEVSIRDISACIKKHDIPIRRYIPQKDIHIRGQVYSLKDEYNMNNKDIALIIGKSIKQVNRILLERDKNVQSQKPNNN
ncbi:MAG: hypothetical protein IJ889_00300 [Eubacterium sp.]|nr:hypothetical protein [Eubacterium sp.]MBR2247284.1 hypothetical protein [Bacilli bacterium]